MSCLLCVVELAEEGEGEGEGGVVGGGVEGGGRGATASVAWRVGDEPGGAGGAWGAGAWRLASQARRLAASLFLAEGPRRRRGRPGPPS